MIDAIKAKLKEYEGAAYPGSRYVQCVNALEIAIDAMGPCTCDNQHQYTCLICEVVPEIARKLGIKDEETKC